MEINRNSKIIFSVFIFIALIAFAAWIFTQKGKVTQNKENGSTAKSSSRIQTADRVAAINLSGSERTNSGITTIKLAKTLHQAQLTAYGSVVSVQDLSRDVQNFEADKAQVTKSKQNLLISQQNFERIKNLYEKKLASQQDFQTSQAAFLSDQADVNSARSNLNSLKSSIVEQWGDELSKWIFNGSSSLQSLLELKQVLIQISLPPDEMSMEFPAKIFLHIPSGKSAKILCKFVSAGHLVNSQFQTKILYYIAPAASLSGGMNVKAFLPVGKKLNGVIVPSSSIVWYQGKAWIYAEKSPDNFIRVEVDTSNPFDNGFFIPMNKGLINSGVTIVEEGAQLLLSQELTPAQSIKTGGDEND